MSASLRTTPSSALRARAVLIEDRDAPSGAFFRLGNLGRIASRHGGRTTIGGGN